MDSNSSLYDDRDGLKQRQLIISPDLSVLRDDEREKDDGRTLLLTCVRTFSERSY